MKQSEIEFLHSQGSYEGEGFDGQLIETHISWVLFTSEFAFKIKKPLQFSFLDFSTREKRAHFLQRELKLNRRLASIYLDLQPIKDRGGKLFIGDGKGRVIDHALRMQRMDAEKKMDVLLRKDMVSFSHISTLAEKICRFHTSAEVVHRKFDLKQAKEDFNDLDSVSGWVGSHLGKEMEGLIRSAFHISDIFLEGNASAFQRRIDHHFVRDIHGDLHSRNIFLYPDPVIFDCIEFNDMYRQIDLLNEIAFFVMDLEAYGHEQLSHTFLKDYLHCTQAMQEPVDRKIFTYYKAYRANVRAKVNALRASQGEDANGEKSEEECSSYLTLMNRYLDELSV